MDNLALIACIFKVAESIMFCVSIFMLFSRQKKITEELQRGIDFVNQQINDAHIKLMAEEGVAYARMLAKKMADAKFCSDKKVADGKCGAH